MIGESVLTPPAGRAGTIAERSGNRQRAVTRWPATWRAAHATANAEDVAGGDHGRGARATGYAAPLADTMHPSLFPDLSPRPVPNKGPRPVGPFATVAIERSLDRVLDYAIPANLVASLRVGQRVRAPLGRNNKPVHGYVVAVHDTTELSAVKPLFEIDDERVLLTPTMLDLALWMSRYYICPLGTVIESIIPSAVKKKVGLDYVPYVRLARPPEEVQAILEKTKAPKRRAILARLLQLEPEQAVALPRLAGEANSTPATVRKLARLGLILITQEPDHDSLLPDIIAPAPGEPAAIPELNEDQRAAFEDMSPRVAAGGFSVNLLRGVTGSGKTEVYLRCIEEVVRQGRQAIVLVPEIALTPQTVRRFTARFPRVAVLHSGLGASQRHRYWQQIWRGAADVVVGARSAIFAPLPNAGIIVVDEEHEASYKQDSAPRYHARDIAIKRAQLENIPVLLGSATPSLETYYRVTKEIEAAGVRGQGSEQTPEPPAEQSGPSIPLAPSLPSPIENQKSKIKNSLPTYHLLELPNRVRGLKMPDVELLDMKQDMRLRKGVHLLSMRLEKLLETTVKQGHQAILLLNRRGYSNFVYCPSCTNVIQCKYCDATMTYHRSAGQNVGTARSSEGVHTGQLHCHYCLAVNPLPDKCADCGKKLSLFGLGTQRVEEELKRKFPELRFARVDSDSMRSGRDYEELLARFASGEVQVLLGTQMIAKGLDYPNVTLVGVISGDTALSLPDFRSAERTFQLITQVAGRAGRGDNPGRVILQTFLPKDPTIQFALRQDFVGFAKSELRQRQEVGLPPVTRMVRVIVRDEDLEKLDVRCQEIAAELAAAVAAGGPGVKLKGPMPCAITRIAGYFRNQVLLFAPTASALQRVLAVVRKDGGFATSDRVAVDVDPVSLL